ncbi:alpha/beta fold hydrolase [Pseudothauera rhizosphaerae]|uniref:alpha/beta fold hydrolase n=1 Tax=Pseudothauera rhizosphaerae TaxID=2565932 RepID=UPI001B3B2A2B|nr:alpha/beta fold hydrolase [Pseudothauera rhizosphaerae]
MILLHGIGMSHAAWNPVIPLLAAERQVIAFDTAGFGDTPPLPDGVVPTVRNLVATLADSLGELGITTPVDIAGNSLGGLMALEAAKLGIARSVVALSPAGLWKESISPHVRHVFQGLRWSAQTFPALARAALRFSLTREAILAIPLSPGSRKMPASDAIRVMEDFSGARSFDATFANLHRFASGQSISVPVTVAFGGRDWILPKSSQRRDELPLQTRWVFPRNWGHVPMWVDPEGVVRLILEGTQ